MERKSSKTCSMDLRGRVIKSLEEGATQEEAAERFEVSISAVGRWHRRYKKEGTYAAKKRPGAKRKIDPGALEEYVKKHPNGTLKQFSDAFNVSGFAISYWLKILKFSYKKKHSPTWKQTQKSALYI